MRNRLFFFVLSLAIVAFTLLGCGVADDAKRLVKPTEEASPTGTQPATTQGTPAGLEIHLLSPAPNSTDVDPEGTELSWKVYYKGTTTEATGLRFEVYLSTKNPPVEALKNEKGEIVFTKNNLLSGKLLAGTTYYWQVVAKDMSGKLFESEVRSFRTKEPPMPKILLSTPTNGAAGVELRNVTLRWNAEKPADFTEFEVLVSTSTEFSGAVKQKTKSTSVQIEGPLQKSTKYVWKVVGYLTNGRTVESGVFSFETVAPSTPVFHSSDPRDGYESPSTKNVTFKWSFSDADGDRLSYTFELFSSTPTESATPLIKEQTDASEYKLARQLDYGARYYWRVEARDLDGNTVRSPVFSFVTPKSPLPENPRPSDAAGSVPISTRELSWEYDASGVAKQPSFVVLFGESEADMKVLAEVTSTSVTLPTMLSYQTTYFWKVVVRRDDEVVAEGPVWKFRTQELPKVTTTNPANGGYLTSDRKVSWKLESVLPSDHKVRFVLATSTEMPPIHSKDIEPSSAEFVLPKEVLAKGRTYFWTLQLTDTNGKTFAYPWFSFRTPEPVALGELKLLEPRSGEEVEPGKVTVKWEHAARPEQVKVTYDLLLGQEPGNLTVVASGLERNSYEIPGIKRGLTYYWRVRAVDQDENTVESEVSVFRVLNVLEKEEFDDESFLSKYKLTGLFKRETGLVLYGRSGAFLKMMTRPASSSELEFEVELSERSILQIDYYVSSEEGYDFFKVFVNDEEVLRDSGEKPWQTFSYELAPGRHRIKLAYVKDEVRTRGWCDAVFIDRIVLKRAY